MFLYINTNTPKNNDNSTNQCGAQTNSITEGGTFHCPTTTNCESCTWNCEGDYACRGANIYSYHCKNVTLNVGSGTDTARLTSNYAPDNGGNFYVNVSSAVDIAGFRAGRVYSVEGTGQIRVDCHGGGYSECRNMFVDGGNATKVDVNCESGVSCRDFTLYCPVDSSLDGTGEKSCNLACDDSLDCSGDVFVSTGDGIRIWMYHPMIVAAISVVLMFFVMVLQLIHVVFQQ